MGVVLLPSAATADAPTVIAYSAGISTGGGPFGIAPGPDGTMWFTEGPGDRIGKITPAGVVTEYSAGISPGSYPTAIVAGPDGNMWFTETVGDRIGKITPDGVVTEYSAGISPDSYPSSIVVGPDGNLWFTENRGAKDIGKITPDGVVTEYTTGLSGSGIDDGPLSIAAGPDGNLWFTQFLTGTDAGNTIGKITTTGVVTLYSAGVGGTPYGGGGPYGITAGPDGNMWFTEVYGDRIGKITPAGMVTEYSTGLTAAPYRITVGPDGNLWFVEAAGSNKIGEITTGGQVTEYSADFNGTYGYGIAAGPGGSLWFTDTTDDEIVETTVDTTPPSITCGAADANWHAANVSISCTAFDSGSGLADPADASFSLSTDVASGSETADASTGSRRICDNAGNCATAGPISGNEVDLEPPTVTCPSPMPAFPLNGSGTVTADVSDGGSGPAAPTVSAAADTSLVGTNTVSLSARDNVGNSSTVSCAYQVTYVFSGFAGPITSPPSVNTGRAGKTYPLKWQLADANGALITSLGAVTGLTVKPTACSSFTSDPTDALEAEATGGTSLRFDTTSNQFVYNWSTPGPGCYTLFLELASGQSLTAYFSLS